MTTVISSTSEEPPFSITSEGCGTFCVIIVAIVLVLLLFLLIVVIVVIAAVRCRKRYKVSAEYTVAIYKGNEVKLEDLAYHM